MLPQSAAYRKHSHSQRKNKRTAWKHRTKAEEVRHVVVLCLLGADPSVGFCPAMGPEFCQRIPSALVQGPYIVLLKSPGREPVAWCRACSLSGQIPTLALSRSVGTLIRLHTCHRMIQEDPEGSDGFLKIQNSIHWFCMGIVGTPDGTKREKH